MGLETGTYVDDLVTTNPVGTSDPKSQGDDHLRLIKSVLKATFPNADKAFYFPTVGAAKTSGYTIVAADDHAVILVDTSGGAVTLDLTASSSLPDGFLVHVLVVDASNATIIDPASSETVNGASTLTLSVLYESVTLINDQGNGWYAFRPVVTPSSTVTFTNKTIDGDNNTLSNLDHGAEVDNPSSGVHGVTGSVVGTTDTQTLSGKTLTSPVLNTGVSGTAVKDEDNMASDSASHLATQQSIKAYVDANSGGVDIGSAVSTVSSLDEAAFTGIPAGTNLIIITLNGVSPNGTGDYEVEIGDSGGLETSGYTSHTLWHENFATPATEDVTDAWKIVNDAELSAGDAIRGHIILTRVTGNTWFLSSKLWSGSGANDWTHECTGAKTLSGTLDRLSVKTTGTGSWDAGTINIVYG